MRNVGLLSLSLLAFGCGEEEKNPTDINDADLGRLKIEAIDASSVHIYSTEEVMEGHKPVTLQNVTQGPHYEALSADDGKIDFTATGALTHVYALQSEDADPLPIVLDDAGTVVRGYGIGFTGPTGCETEGWSGIIRDAAGDALTSCSLAASITPSAEVAHGDVEPFILRRDTRVIVTAAINGVDGQQPRFEIDFVDQVPEAFTVPVIAQNPGGQFGPTVLQLGQISPELPGRIVESLEVRSPPGSGLVIADITFVKVDPVEEL